MICTTPPQTYTGPSAPLLGAAHVRVATDGQVYSEPTTTFTVVGRPASLLTVPAPAAVAAHQAAAGALKAVRQRALFDWAPGRNVTVLVVDSEGSKLLDFDVWARNVTARVVAVRLVAANRTVTDPAQVARAPLPLRATPGTRAIHRVDGAAVVGWARIGTGGTGVLQRSH